MPNIDLKARPSTLFYLAVSLLIIACYFVLSLKLFEKAQRVTQLDFLEISRQNTPLNLGRDELAQKNHARSAEKEHVSLRFDPKNGWEIANIAKYKRVDAPGGGLDTRYLKRFRLQAGDVIKIKAQSFRVLAVDPQLTMRHEESGQQIEWQGGTHGRVQVAPAASSSLAVVCPEDPTMLSAWLPDMSSVEKRLFSIGGSVTCAKRWGVLQEYEPLLKPDSARIYLFEKGYWLGSGINEAESVRFISQGKDDERTFSQKYTPFLESRNVKIEKLVIGRSSYKVDISKDRNTLRLTRQYGDVWTPVEWEKRQHEPGFTKNDHLQANMTPETSFGQALQLWSILLSLTSLVVSTALAMTGRLRSYSGALWVFALMLLLVGNLVLLQLAIGGMNERVLGLSSRFLRLSLVFQGLLFLLLWVPSVWMERSVKILFRIDRARTLSLIDWVLYGLLTVYILLLSVQAAGGSESGLGWFQPVEFSKFIIVLIGAVSAAQYYEKRYLDAYHSASDGNWWSLGQTVKLFALLGTLIVLTALMLMMVRDYSPIVLMMIYLLIFIWRMLPHPVDGSYSKLAWALVGMLTAAMALPIGLLLYVKRQGVVPSFLMNAERFQVWASPESYPHSGSQVRDSMSLIADSRAWGAEYWFGTNDNALMQLPEVQNDFIATFVIAHFGYYPALLLLLVQLLFVLQLVRLSNALLRGDSHLYDSASRRQMGFSGSLFCFGFAGLLLAHWLMSWCNVLGLLPVMGQPMTLLSSGGSNLILFFAPCLLLCFCFAWLQERQPEV